MKIDTILKKIDETSESELKDMMENEYIDTPWGFWSERKDYNNDIQLYYKQNMGKEEYAKLLKWIKDNKQKTKLLFTNKK